MFVIVLFVFCFAFVFVMSLWDLLCLLWEIIDKNELFIVFDYRKYNNMHKKIFKQHFPVYNSQHEINVSEHQFNGQFSILSAFHLQQFRSTVISSVLL